MRPTLGINKKDGIGYMKTTNSKLTAIMGQTGRPKHNATNGVYCNTVTTCNSIAHNNALNSFLSFHFYARKQQLLSARLSHRNSVRPSVRLSVTRVYQSKTVQDRITKSSPPAAWKTLVSGTA